MERQANRLNRYCFPGTFPLGSLGLLFVVGGALENFPPPAPLFCPFLSDHFPGEVGQQAALRPRT